MQVCTSHPIRKISHYTKQHDNTQPSTVHSLIESVSVSCHCWVNDSRICPAQIMDDGRVQYGGHTTSCCAFQLTPHWTLKQQQQQQPHAYHQHPLQYVKYSYYNLI